jgi:hypothetical protein
MFTQNVYSLLKSGLFSFRVDKKRQQISLYHTYRLVGSIAYFVKSNNAFVSMAVTIGERRGYGYLLYAGAMCHVNQKGLTLSPDPDCVLGNSISLWSKIWKDSNIVRAPLPFESQSFEYNLDLAEELVETNPDISEEQWDALFEEAGTGLINAISSGIIAPHAYNHGYTLPAEMLSFLADITTYKELGEEEKTYLSNLWTERFAA